MLNTKFCFADCRVRGKIFRGLASQKLAALEGDILELGSYNNTAQLGKCPILFSLKNHSTLLHNEGGCIFKDDLGFNSNLIERYNWYVYEK